MLSAGDNWAADGSAKQAAAPPRGTRWFFVQTQPHIELLVAEAEA
jgi:hypothetical protein